MLEVQSMILNLSFPQSLEEVRELTKEGKELFIDSLLNCADQYSWTAPKWMKAGDIVFFMYSKTSLQTIRRLKREMKQDLESYDADTYRAVWELLDRGEELYKTYGRKIFVVAQIDGKPFYEEKVSEDKVHWRTRVYAYIRKPQVLSSPIDLSEFNSFITLSCGGSITPVYAQRFEELKALVKSRNEIPDYLEESVAMPIPFVDIDDSNWLEITSQYRRNFMYEEQFRCYYVDHFLRIFGDRRRRPYKECQCIKKGKHPSYVDNVVLLEGMYLPVEIKLSISAEQDLNGQVRKYCHLDTMILANKGTSPIAPKDSVITDSVMVMDTAGVYLYSYDTDTINPICNLNEIRTNTDILSLRNKIIGLLDVVSRKGLLL